METLNIKISVGENKITAETSSYRYELLNYTPEKIGDLIDSMAQQEFDIISIEADGDRDYAYDAIMNWAEFTEKLV